MWMCVESWTGAQQIWPPHLSHKRKCYRHILNYSVPNLLGSRSKRIRRRCARCNLNNDKNGKAKEYTDFHPRFPPFWHPSLTAKFNTRKRASDPLLPDSSMIAFQRHSASHGSRVWTRCSALADTSFVWQVWALDAPTPIIRRLGLYAWGAPT
jgi:hypothetical protein